MKMKIKRKRIQNPDPRGNDGATENQTLDLSSLGKRKNKLNEEKKGKKKNQNQKQLQPPHLLFSFSNVSKKLERALMAFTWCCKFIIYSAVCSNSLSTPSDSPPGTMLCSARIFRSTASFSSASSEVETPPFRLSFCRIVFAMRLDFLPIRRWASRCVRLRRKEAGEDLCNVLSIRDLWRGAVLGFPWMASFSLWIRVLSMAARERWTKGVWRGRRGDVKLLLSSGNVNANEAVAHHFWLPQVLYFWILVCFKRRRTRVKPFVTWCRAATKCHFLPFIFGVNSFALSFKISILISTVILSLYIFFILHKYSFQKTYFFNFLSIFLKPFSKSKLKF